MDSSTATAIQQIRNLILEEIGKAPSIEPDLGNEDLAWNFTLQYMVKKWWPELVVATQDLAAPELSAPTLTKVDALLSGIDKEQIHDDGFLSAAYEAFQHFRWGGNSKFQKQFSDVRSAITQIYTPSWLCKLMADESLAEYINENPDQDIRTIKILDPACGSGNFLMAAFDSLFALYTQQGEAALNIPRLILENNLYGFDVEEQATVLARINLFKKALKAVPASQWGRHHIGNASFIERLKAEHLHSSSASCFETLKQADKFGILLQVPGDCSMKEKDDELANFLEICSTDFDVILANPPYVPAYLYDEEMRAFTKAHYSGPPNLSANLYACFIGRMTRLLKENGRIAWIHPASLFYEKDLADARDLLCSTYRFKRIISIPSRTLFHSHLPDYNILILSGKKSTGLDSVEFLRVVGTDNEGGRTMIERSFLDKAENRKVKMKKVSFWLRHPFVYDRFLRFF